MPTPARALRAVSAAASAVALLSALAAPAAAAPTCPDEATRPVCGGRVVPEAERTATFLQYGSEALAALEAIEALAPRYVEVHTLAELTGDPGHVSAGGRDIYVVRVTDEESTADKRVAVASLSVHGNESAGREGGIRYIEDLARWATTDPDRLLYAGDVGLPVRDVLARVEAWFGFTNPDGWAMGDVTDPENVTFMRGNSNGVDLNREFDTIGWTERAYTTFSEPEAVGWAAFVSSLPEVTTATDIHGELTSATDSFADMMWPAGQWPPRRQAQELQLAQHVEATVERKFAEYGIRLQQLLGPTVGQDPATYATAYDIVGYDDSGFMGDWFTQRHGAVEIDVENFLSHLIPSNVWVGELEAAHVAAVRGILEAVMVEALLTDQVEPRLDLGRVAYVHDPAIVTSADGFGFELEEGERPRPYAVTRMRYFQDLAVDAGVPVTPIAAADVPTADLASYDTIVLADVAVPADTHGRPVDRAAYVAALDRFVRGGGQLLLTDGAVPFLVDLGLFDAADLATARTNAGHIDFGAYDHDWERDLSGLASQTYYEVPLGFPPEDTAPHHGVLTDAWEAAGGVTAGTVDEAEMTALGELAVGAGKVAIFGAILPTQHEAAPHLFGLADYGVTVAGGQVLHAILEYRRPDAVGTGGGPGGAGGSGAPAASGGGALPATGGGAVFGAVALLLAGRSARGRRRR